MNAAQRSLAERARRLVFGRREIGQDKGVVRRRVEQGEEFPATRDAEWPASAADVNPHAAAYRDATATHAGGLP